MVNPAVVRSPLTEIPEDPAALASYIQGQVIHPPRKPDMVNHPPHYTSHPSGVECIDITRHMNFNLGNATKYVWRADLKGDAIEDLEKAVFYLNDEIKKLRAGDSH